MQYLGIEGSVASQESCSNVVGQLPWAMHPVFKIWHVLNFLIVENTRFGLDVTLLNGFLSSSCRHEALILCTFTLTMGGGAGFGGQVVPHRHHNMGWGQQPMWIPDVSLPGFI